MKIKAISLWEPWASLIRTGAKTFETRSWSTPYRGPLVICAAKGGLSKTDLIFHLSRWVFQGGLAPLVGKPLDLSGNSWPGICRNNLNFGKAICVVDLVDCIKTDDLTVGQIATDEPFGDFSPGRFAWKLENLRVFEKPLEVTGRQGFFTVDIPSWYLGLYRPSTGTEGCDFRERWCDKCVRDLEYRKNQEGGCEIMAATMAFDVDEAEYPKEWTYDENGTPCCTAFQIDEHDNTGYIMKLREEKGQLRLFN